MAITSYSTLKTAIESWTHRSDLDSVVDDFIDITESRLNRLLRVSQMEVRATATASTEYLAMPTDLLAIRNIQLNTNPVTMLTFLTPAEMDRLAENNSDLQYYSIVGDEIQLNATSDSSIEIAYYAKISALSDSNTSNWLLAAHPEAYLYGCLAEAFKYGMDEEQATKYHNLFNEVIQQIRTLDTNRKYSQNLTVRVA